MLGLKLPNCKKRPNDWVQLMHLGMKLRRKYKIKALIE
jgi:hypothetical protein